MKCRRNKLYCKMERERNREREKGEVYREEERGIDRERVKGRR